MVKGFTLIELLLSISIFAIIAVAALPVSRAFQARNNLDIAVATVADTVRRAETLARGMDGDSAWGISAATSSITLFMGTSFAVRNGSFDEVSAMPPDITLSGLTEIVFVKFTGYPQSSGSFTLTGVDNETRSVAINSRGTVSF